MSALTQWPAGQTLALCLVTVMLTCTKVDVTLGVAMIRATAPMATKSCASSTPCICRKMVLLVACGPAREGSMDSV